MQKSELLNNLLNLANPSAKPSAKTKTPSRNVAANFQNSIEIDPQSFRDLIARSRTDVAAEKASKAKAMESGVTSARANQNSQIRNEATQESRRALNTARESKNALADSRDERLHEAKQKSDSPLKNDVKKPESHKANDSLEHAKHSAAKTTDELDQVDSTADEADQLGVNEAAQTIVAAVDGETIEVDATGEDSSAETDNSGELLGNPLSGLDGLVAASSSADEANTSDKTDADSSITSAVELDTDAVTALRGNSEFAIADEDADLGKKSPLGSDTAVALTLKSMGQAVESKKSDNGQLSLDSDASDSIDATADSTENLLVKAGEKPTEKLGDKIIQQSEFSDLLGKRISIKDFVGADPGAQKLAGLAASDNTSQINQNPLLRAEALSPSARTFVIQTGLGQSLGQPQWSQAVSDRVLWLAAQNLSAADIRLDPPDLGTMHIKVSVHNDQATVSFASPHAVVREALDQQSTRLREMFAEQGLNLVNVDVSERHSNGKHGHQEQSAGQQSSNLNDEESLQVVAVTSPQQVRLVDHYA